MFSPNTPITTIPGTFAYDRLAIPAVVRQKADEINRLKIQHGTLGLPVPRMYADPSTLGFMSIPVFDSSHPEVQTAMQNSDTVSLSNRQHRHLLDANTFDTAFARYSDPANPPICNDPNCVHPLQRGKLLIDTALQDEILQVLRGAVAGITTTSTTTTSTTTTTTTTPRSGFIEVPGTVRYVQNAIPADVQTKANEINRLKPMFDALRPTPAVPPVYTNVYDTSEIFAIPVFDASHPAVQTALRSGESTRINNRDIRHIMEKDSLETWIALGTSWAPKKCPGCRHPEDGGIRREHLRIDTALQVEILQFLRASILAGGGTTT